MGNDRRQGLCAGGAEKHTGEHEYHREEKYLHDEAQCVIDPSSGIFEHCTQHGSRLSLVF